MARRVGPDVVLLLPSAVLLAVVLAAVLAPLIAPYDPSTQQLTLRLRPPSWLPGGDPRFLLGTDHLGRDVLSRLLHGARVSLPIALTATTVRALIILESTLSFLGLGIQAPLVSWGKELSDARQYIQLAWWTTTFPGLAILVVVLSINLLGDCLRDVLDPRLRGR